MIAFYVQGGGLGHLARTHKLIRYLKIDANDVVIITPSMFKHYFKEYRFITISWNDTPSAWSKTIIHELKQHSIQVCYVDAFPLGMKGELIPVYQALKTISFQYVCRALVWSKYLAAMPITFSPSFTKTIVLETIYEDHYVWVNETSMKVAAVQLPIYSSKNQIRLIHSPYVLVIHSGGKEDVIDLCKKVQSSLKNIPITVFVFTQVVVEFDDERYIFRVQEYPVENYFKYASKIYTAAGFNLIQELVPYHKKHIIYPIDRLYDDQFFRMRNSARSHLK